LFAQAKLGQISGRVRTQRTTVSPARGELSGNEGVTPWRPKKPC